MAEIQEDSVANPRRKCCNALRFEGVKEAKGYNALGIGRGPIVMSNIFLSSSFLRLASEAAGCIFHDEDDAIDTPTCTSKIYGFRPSSLISNIAIIAGLLAAFTMPFIGALIDYTPYRRMVGIVSATIMLAIQAIQIGTVGATWFPMAILQAIAAFVYQAQVLATYAYLPDIARVVGQDSMTNFTSIYVITQFLASLVFLLLVSIVAMLAGFDDVTTGQFSQAINVVWVGLAFFYGWKLLPEVPALQTPPEGRSLAVAGFVKLWETTKGINKHYGGSVRWYFLAVIFAEAGYNAFTVVSVIYLSEVIKMSGGEIGIVFAIVYVASFPGSRIGAFVSRKTNPVMSWKINIVIFSIFTISGGFVLINPSRKILTYIWSILWGMGLGWFYPTENLIFSMILPRGQEAELTGYFVYCTQILVWLPPLVFTTINEVGIHMKYALMSLVIFFAIALALLMCMDPWDTVLETVTAANQMNKEIRKTDEEEKA